MTRRGASGSGSSREEGTVFSAYYFSTPLFALADALGVEPFRVAGLADSDLRWAYYAAVFLLGLVCHRWPRSAPWVGMGESAGNLLLLLLAFLLPIWSFPEAVARGEPAPAPVTMGAVGNLILSGGMLLFSFYRSQHEIARRRGLRI